MRRDVTGIGAGTDDRTDGSTGGGWNRRDFLRAGLTGATALVAGGLGGFALGRVTAPAQSAPHSIGAVSPTREGVPQFPIRVAADQRSFVDAGDQPFYYLADTAWNAISRMTKEAFEALATARRDRGFTAMQLSLLDFDPAAANVYGNRPFTSKGAFDKPLVASGGEDYWSHVDNCIDVCRRLGLVVCLVPAWYGGWGDAWRGYLTEENAASFGGFLAERFGARDNVWWLLGGDNAPVAEGDSVKGVPGNLDRGPRVTQTVNMGRALHTTSAVTPLMSYHTARGQAVEEYFGSEPWYQISAAYSGADPVPTVSTEFARPTVRPVILWEAFYDQRTREPILDRQALRAQAYQALLSGAAGFAYGHEQVWPVLEGWVEALDAPSARDIEVFSTVVGTYAAGALTPITADGDGSGLLPDGWGSQGATSMVTAAKLPDRPGALVYFAEPRASVVVNTTVLDAGASFDIRWIDPATGEQFFFGEDRAGTAVEISWPSSWADAVLVVAS